VVIKDSWGAGAKEWKKLGISMVEGKTHLPFGAYRLQAKMLFKSNHPEHL
jgi:hypothetical protein